MDDQAGTSKAGRKEGGGGREGGPRVLTCWMISCGACPERSMSRRTRFTRSKWTPPAQGAAVVSRLGLTVVVAGAGNGGIPSLMRTCDADFEVDHVAEPAVEGVDALQDDDPARGDLHLLVPHAGARLEVVDRHLVGDKEAASLLRGDVQLGAARHPPPTAPPPPPPFLPFP